VPTTGRKWQTAAVGSCHFLGISIKTLSPKSKPPNDKRTYLLTKDGLVVNADQLEVGQTLALYLATESQDMVYLVNVLPPKKE
jgi:hypothetical protein